MKVKVGYTAYLTTKIKARPYRVQLYQEQKLWEDYKVKKPVVLHYITKEVLSVSKSPNHYNGRNGWRPDVIVCHITEGGFNGAVSWLCNPASKASAHFVVGAKGEVAQLVDLKDAAWCNGNNIKDPNSRLYYRNALNALVRSRKDNANYYTYSIEHEGYSYKDRYGALTEEQYQASLATMKRIIQHMKEAYGVTFKPDREHLIGHYEIDPRGKPNCPAPNKGKNFPFDRFIRDLQAWMGDNVPPTQEDFKPYTVRVATDSLNIRSGAGTGYKVVGAIKDKGIYTIVEQRFGTGALIWGKLKSGAGWIALDYTQKVNPASPTQDTFRPYLVKITAHTLNIRAGAGTNHKVVGTVKEKGVYTIVEEKTGTGAKLWGKLKSGVGWVSLDFVTKV